MRPVLRWLVRLYPADWRARYGEEFLALLEDSRPRPTDIVDIITGAVDAHLQGGSFMEDRTRWFGVLPLVSTVLFALGFFYVMTNEGAGEFWLLAAAILAAVVSEVVVRLHHKEDPRPLTSPAAVFGIGAGLAAAVGLFIALISGAPGQVLSHPAYIPMVILTITGTSIIVGQGAVLANRENALMRWHLPLLGLCMGVALTIAMSGVLFGIAGVFTTPTGATLFVVVALIWSAHHITWTIAVGMWFLRGQFAQMEPA